VAINRALVEGTPNRRIASHHDVTERAVRNHKAGHLPTALVKAREAEEVADADDLLSQVKDLQTRTLTVLDKAECAGDLRTALGAIREARGNVELLAKLLGELDARPQVNVVLIDPQVRDAIVRALAPYGEARLAVAGALERFEDAS
jgi:hypothetical protein